MVVSNTTYNQMTELAMVCPITNTRRAFPLHVPLPNQIKTRGYIMCEQVKALDIIERHASFIEHATDDIKDEVYDILFGMIEIED